MADKRITPARADLAAAHLQGKVAAARFVEGEKTSVLAGRAALRSRPDALAPQETELLRGEIFTVYERENGWAWGQIKSDGYVGYVRTDALGDPIEPTHRVTALSTPLMAAPDVKSPCLDILPLGAAIAVTNSSGDFLQISGGFVHYRPLVPITEHAVDFVSVAQRFLGAPYVWGGKTVAGLDCSGLIQISLAAAGIFAPRDTDMMEKALGLPVSRADAVRGDLVFWKGHMGVMLDAHTLLHANAFHMEVFAEDLDQAALRIAQSAGPITSIHRL